MIKRKIELNKLLLFPNSRLLSLSSANGDSGKDRKESPKHRLLLNPKSYRQEHPLYRIESIQEIKETHVNPKNFADRLAYYSVRGMRTVFDIMSRFNKEKMSAD